jgi:hypothetical protein
MKKLKKNGGKLTYILDTFPCAITIMVCTILLAGTIAVEGLANLYPNKDADIAFNIAKVKILLNNFNPYTPIWYFGSDLLRFYPPLSTLIPYALSLFAPSVEQTLYWIMFICYVVNCLGYVLFINSFLKSRVSAVFVGVVLPLLHAVVVTFQGHYWEFARLLGTCTIPWALYVTERSLRRPQGPKLSDAILIALLSSFTALSNLIAFLYDFVAIYLVYLIVRGIVIPPEGEPERWWVPNRTIKLIKYFVAVLVILTAWWYVSALFPYGISIYLPLEFFSSPGQTLFILWKSISALNYPAWAPWAPRAIQIPIVVLGALGVYLAYRKRDRRGMVLTCILASTLFIMLLGYHPGRLLYTLGVAFVMLSAFSIDYLVNHARRIHTSVKVLAYVVLTLFLIFFVSFYLPTYSSWCRVGSPLYALRDEHLTAVMLNKLTEGGKYRVYVMWGGYYRGSQWLNVFQPNIPQVLGGYDVQGAVKPLTVDVPEDCRGYMKFPSDPFAFDALVKYGKGDEATELLYSLCKKYSVKYIVVDKRWMMEFSPDAYLKFVNSQLFKPIAEFEFAQVFEVCGIEPLGR